MLPNVEHCRSLQIPKTSSSINHRTYSDRKTTLLVQAIHEQTSVRWQSIRTKCPSAWTLELYVLLQRHQLLTRTNRVAKHLFTRKN